MKNTMRPAPSAPPPERALPPTREALLRLLRAQRAPASVAALATATGWHGNTVRAHLQALWEDGLVNRASDAPDGRGRPSWLWSATDRPAGSPYAALAGVLAETVARLSPEPERDARAAGRTWGLSIGDELPAASTAAELRARVLEAMRAQGFSPEVREVREAGTASDAHRAPRERGELTATTVALRQCPLIEAASTHPEVVCAVHLGMIAGIAEALGGTSEGSALTPFNAPGECELRLTVASS